MDDELDEVVAEFLVESRENLDILDRSLVDLEQDPTDPETLSAVFRTMHTIKGTSGFLGFGQLESLTHAAESLLSRLRDQTLQLTPAITTALLQTGDAVRALLEDIERDGAERDADHSALVARLGELQADPGSPAASEPTPLGQVLVEQGRASAEDIDAAVLAQMEGDPRHLGEILVHQGVVDPTEVLDALKIQQGDDEAGRAAAVVSAPIRVDVGLLDKLMNLVSELVLARNQVLQFTVTNSDPALVSTAQRLDLITTELQEGVMKTRMQPIDTVWSKFPRVVRDLALNCGKRVRLDMEGRDTELDKTIIEAIKDPLTHLVRNAVDHGIEAPDARAAAGKAPEGRLALRAFHEGGHVNIELSDDGAGIDCSKVRAKAVARGLVRPEVAERMTDRELAGLIFLPGFSTADQVTNVSGRGVGMDVVKTNIERIGGTVDVASEPGAGTTFRIKIPLTLAIIPALIVTTAGDRYAIPQVSLVELVRLEGEQARTGIEYVHGAPVHRLRGNLLPLVRLDRELGVQGGEAEGDSGVSIVVLQSGDQQFGLIVDGISDTEEIVVKPLGRQLKSVTVFAGATIMGDGRVALILDVLGLAQRAGVVGEARSERTTTKAEDESAADRRTLLVLGVGADRRMAVPLDAVARLEEFDHGVIERAGDREVVQYRDAILPLVRIADVVGAAARPDADADAPVQVVVHTAGDTTIGLVVDEILDIVDETVVVHPTAGPRGVLGAAVVQGLVTELVDLPGIVAGLAGTILVGAGA